MIVELDAGHFPLSVASTTKVVELVVNVPKAKGELVQVVPVTVAVPKGVKLPPL